MRTLVLGAGATGGYLGATLLAASRDVTFLVRPRTAARLRDEGLRVRDAGGTTDTHRVSALTAEELRTAHDLVVVAVRGADLDRALADLGPAVGPATQILPLLNGVAHLDVLVGAFGRDAVLGATVRLAATLLPDGTLLELAPGIALELGRPGPGPDPAGSDRMLEEVHEELAVGGVSVTVTADIEQALWSKWTFIAASAVLTSLAGGVVGEVASARGGIELARTVVAETAAIAGAEGRPGDGGRELLRTLTDPTSRFAPSLTRELWAGRPVEIEVLDDLAARARRHQLASPLLDASLVRLRLAGATAT